MKIGYLDLHSGISGDIFAATFIDAIDSFDILKNELSKLRLDDQFRIDVSKIKRKGIIATRFHVQEKKEKLSLRRYKDIVRIIEESELSEDVKKDSLAILKILGESESLIHGILLDDVHFHEIGAIDTIVDIVSASLLFSLSKISKLYISPINTGEGTVKTEHGIIPVPAPATAYILRGLDIYSDGIKKELTTPTGAAIIKHYAKGGFSNLHLMKISKIGYGAGGYDLIDRANVARLIIADVDKPSFNDLPVDDTESSSRIVETLIELTTEIDDMSPERYSYLYEKLFESNALDVIVTASMMKKQRQGQTLKVLVSKDDMNRIEEILFAETTTIGIKRNYVERVLIKRKIVGVKTIYGDLKVKVSSLAKNKNKIKIEYDDIVKIAKREARSYHEVELELKKIVLDIGLDHKDFEQL